jgi:peptidoglycan/xylan/chitin deacetylase (PgdA/CDA1 family)
MTVSSFAPQRIPVLLYHRIADDDGDRFAVPPAAFAEHLQLVCESGRTSLTVTELADGIRGQRPLPDRAVAITFDDGYSETPDAVARLREHGLRVTVYVTAGELDRPTMLSGGDLEALERIGDGIELGAHSVTHPYLDAVAPASARAEVRHSKEILERHTVRPVETFAYPHGAYDARVREAVLAAGYRSAAAVKNAISHRGDDPWAIARYTVTRTTTSSRLEALLRGDGAPLAWRHERLQTRAARQARRIRHRLPRRSPGSAGSIHHRRSSR